MLIYPILLLVPSISIVLIAPFITLGGSPRVQPFLHPSFSDTISIFIISHPLVTAPSPQTTLSLWFWDQIHLSWNFKKKSASLNSRKHGWSHPAFSPSAIANSNILSPYTYQAALLCIHEHGGQSRSPLSASLPPQNHPQAWGERSAALFLREYLQQIPSVFAN